MVFSLRIIELSRSDSLKSLEEGPYSEITLRTLRQTIDERGWLSIMQWSATSFEALGSSRDL